MKALGSWQLVLFLCATVEKMVETWEAPRYPGLLPGPDALLAARERSLRGAEQKQVPARRPGPWQCPPLDSAAGARPAGPCAPRSRLIPAPRGAPLVQREKELAPYNWNSFGLRYGRRAAH